MADYFSKSFNFNGALVLLGWVELTAGPRSEGVEMAVSGVTWRVPAAPVGIAKEGAPAFIGTQSRRKRALAAGPGKAGVDVEENR